jgi:hypothetical protein
MTDDEIPEYRSPRETRLAPHEEEIMELREKRWPYRAILERLEERHQVSVVYSTLREFCLRREISKGAPKRGSRSRKSPPAAPPSPEPEPSIGSNDLDLPKSSKRLVLKVNKYS